MPLWEKLSAIEIPDIVTLAISALGALVALATPIYLLIVKRPSVKVSCIEWRALNGTAFFLLCFANASQLPTAITNISLVIDGNPYPCEPTPKLIRSHTRKVGVEVVSHTDELSVPLPIKLDPRSAQSGLVLFEGLPHIPSADATQVTFQVDTIGRKSKRYVVRPGRVCRL